MGHLASGTDWLFRDRESGRITIAQPPNPPLLVWLGVTVGKRLLDLGGGWRTAANTVATGALVVWAGDEVARGANPFRRLLGGAVLAALAASWLITL